MISALVAAILDRDETIRRQVLALATADIENPVADHALGSGGVEQAVATRTVHRGNLRSSALIDDHVDGW